MRAAPSRSSFQTGPGNLPRCPTSTILCCRTSTSTSAWSMPCCARAESRSAKATFWAPSSSKQGMPDRLACPSRQLIDELLYAAKKRLFGARDMGEAQLQRAIQAIFLGLALDELEHALRVDLVPFLKEYVTIAGAGIDFADAERSGAQLEKSRAEQGLRKGRYRSEAVDHFDFQLVELFA